jgi:hypothetical protein
MMGFALVFVVGAVLRSLFGRVGGAAVTGGLGGTIAWFIVGSVLAAGVIGLIVFVLTAIFGVAGLSGMRRGGGSMAALGGGGGGWSGGGAAVGRAAVAQAAVVVHPEAGGTAPYSTQSPETSADARFRGTETFPSTMLDNRAGVGRSEQTRRGCVSRWKPAWSRSM